MNTVFKFYFLAWALFSVGAAGLLGPELAKLPVKKPGAFWRRALLWGAGFLALLGLGSWGTNGYSSTAWLTLSLGFLVLSLILLPGMRRGPMRAAALALGVLPSAGILIGGFFSAQGGEGPLPALWMLPLVAFALGGTVWAMGGRGRFEAAPYLGTLLGLFLICAKYPFLAVESKVGQTLMNARPGKFPLRLDGLEYLETMPDRQIGTDFTAEDGAVLRHIREKVRTNEIILEAPGVDMYGGLSRMSIFSGLPTLLGWEYQVGQQRSGSAAQGLLGSHRALADLIYHTPDREQARRALESAGVGLIQVGRIERRRYPAESLAKFDGWLPEEFRVGETVLFRFNIEDEK